MPKISGTSLHKLLYPEVSVLHFHKQWKNSVMMLASTQEAQLRINSQEYRNAGAASLSG
jgi:hypothetical protein